jgi:hypothetical protein
MIFDKPNPADQNTASHHARALSLIKPTPAKAAKMEITQASQPMAHRPGLMLKSAQRNLFSTQSPNKEVIEMAANSHPRAFTCPSVRKCSKRVRLASASVGSNSALGAA